MSWNIQLGTADALPLPDRSVQLVLGSPPYTDRRTYGRDDLARKTDAWVPWMLDVSREALRVCSGPVIWVANGCMKDRQYQPAVEGLIWEAFKAGLNVEHPLIWSKNAVPNRRDWWCNGWEYIVAFYPDGWDHDFDWASIASPQKYMKGGAFRQRQKDGSRDIQRQRERSPIARPYDILRATVGGGHLGSKLAHENEAPYPEALVEPIIKALTRPGDSVVDPFSGSGTTVSVAHRLGRYGVGFDCRLSQVFLGRKRVREQDASAARAIAEGEANQAAAPAAQVPGEPAPDPAVQA
jgi:site-specific DNA-methyltransferase (adenine-specific)